MMQAFVESNGDMQFLPDLQAALFMTDERDTLELIRESLAYAQTCMMASRDRNGRLPRDAEHMNRIARLMGEIDRQRPVDSDRRHRQHTAFCGCYREAKKDG